MSMRNTLLCWGNLKVCNSIQGCTCLTSHAGLGFNEFISERERMNPKSKDPRMALFDEIVLSKRNRGRSSFFSGRHTTDFISDTSNHLWRTASATFTPSSKSQQNLSGDYNRIVSRGMSSGKCT